MVSISSCSSLLLPSIRLFCNAVNINSLPTPVVSRKLSLSCWIHLCRAHAMRSALSWRVSHCLRPAPSLQLTRVLLLLDLTLSFPSLWCLGRALLCSLLRCFRLNNAPHIRFSCKSSERRRAKLSWSSRMIHALFRTGTHSSFSISSTTTSLNCSPSTSGSSPPFTSVPKMYFFRSVSVPSFFLQHDLIFSSASGTSPPSSSLQRSLLFVLHSEKKKAFKVHEETFPTPLVMGSTDRRVSVATHELFGS